MFVGSIGQHVVQHYVVCAPTAVGVAGMPMCNADDRIEGDIGASAFKLLGHGRSKQARAACFAQEVPIHHPSLSPSIDVGGQLLLKESVRRVLEQ